MEKERYPNTIGKGTRQFITGIEHLESLLGDPFEDNYNLHDAEITWFHYDSQNCKLEMDICTHGGQCDCPEDKDVYIHFSFEGIVGVETHIECQCFINDMQLSVENNFLLCCFGGVDMEVWAKRLIISPIELRPSVIN